MSATIEQFKKTVIKAADLGSLSTFFLQCGHVYTLPNLSSFDGTFQHHEMDVDLAFLWLFSAKKLFRKKKLSVLMTLKLLSPKL